MDKTYLPSLGVSLPKLGFGCMRLSDDGQGNIEKEAALKLLHTALEAGVDYFDTAYVYHQGKAEAFLGEHFFSTLPRDKFMVATKLPVPQIKEASACAPLFNQQLENLRLDFIDFYLAHNLNKKSWQKFCDLGGADFLLRMKKEGRARFIGFSYHGEPEDLAQVLDAFPWEFVQLQINYYDWPSETQNAKLQYEETVKRGLPLIVMEPVHGGSLANLPPQAAAILQAHQPHPNQARWALRWAGGLPGVHMTLSGMNSAAQLAENLATFSDFQPLTAKEQQIVSQLTQVLLNQPHVGCTLCDYCRAACPQKIAISHAFNSFNDYLRLNDPRLLRNYLLFTPEHAQSRKCSHCASCSPHCPQHLDIPAELAALNKALEDLDTDQSR
ncbi:MAG: aldo/keto reductase [Clostridiales bacterium]|nr:aldo/keto reductase [Clostridiales bacterium]